MVSSRLISSSCWPFTSWRVIHAHFHSVKWNENYAAWGLDELMTAVCVVHRERRWHISGWLWVDFKSESGSKLRRDEDEAEFHLLSGRFEISGWTLKMFRRLEFVLDMFTQCGAPVLISSSEWQQASVFNPSTIDYEWFSFSLYFYPACCQWYEMSWGISEKMSRCGDVSGENRQCQ